MHAIVTSMQGLHPLHVTRSSHAPPDLLRCICQQDRLTQTAATPSTAIKANMPLFQRAMADSMREQPHKKQRKAKK
jgi:hypothetical protein